MRRIILMMLFALVCLPLHAQDGLNLPAELYVLLNSGIVERYSIGAAGVQTVTPPDEFVLDFRVAPDNNWVAYRTLEGLYLRDMYAPDTVRQLEGVSASAPDLRGRGDTVAWSRGADALAYTTLAGGRVYFFESNTFADLPNPNLVHLAWSPDGRYLAAQDSSFVWWIYQREGTGMVLASIITSGIGADWVSLTQMVFAPAEGGLIAMDMAAANEQTVLLDAADHYQLPFFASDNTLLVFKLIPDSTNIGRLNQVTFSASGMTVAELTQVEIDLTGLRWSPDGKLLVVFQGGGLALVEPMSGVGFTLPIATASAYSWGMIAPQSVASLRLPEAGYFLAPGGGFGSAVQVWQMPRNDQMPETLTPASESITEYAVAPDGNQIAYVSAGTLWVYEVGADEEPRSIAETGTIPAEPAFSPDGNFLYYIEAADATSTHIARAEIDKGTTGVFIPPVPQRTYFAPRPAGGVSALAVGWMEENTRRGIAIFDTNTNEQLYELLLDDTGAFYRAPDWLNGTQLLFGGTIVRGGIPIIGLHVLDVNNLTEPAFTVFPITTTFTIHDVVQINRDTLRALIQTQTPGTVAIWDIPLDGAAPTIAGSAGFIAAPRIAPDGSIIAGLNYPGGNMLIYTVQANERLTIGSTGGVTQFQWR
jgi:WD40 repeat protein